MNKKDTAGAKPAFKKRIEFFSGFRENQLADVRNFVKDFICGLPGAGFSDSQIARIQVAAVEVVTNICRHAYEGITGRPIWIEAEDSGDKIIFCFGDQSQIKFIPAFPEKPPEPDPEGGMGMWIICSSVDNVYYFNDESGNNVCLTINKTGG